MNVKKLKSPCHKIMEFWFIICKTRHILWKTKGKREDHVDILFSLAVFGLDAFRRVLSGGFRHPGQAAGVL